MICIYSVLANTFSYFSYLSVILFLMSLIMNVIDYPFLPLGAIYISLFVSVYLNPFVHFPFGYVSLLFICKSFF